MVEAESEVYEVCMEGPKCSYKYLLDYQKRVKGSGTDNQGTGNLVEDLNTALQVRNSPRRATSVACFDRCPIPGERSNVKCPPNGQSRRVYFEDLPNLMKEFEQSPD